MKKNATSSADRILCNFKLSLAIPVMGDYAFLADKKYISKTLLLG